MMCLGRTSLFTVRCRGGGGFKRGRGERIKEKIEPKRGITPLTFKILKGLGGLGDDRNAVYILKTLFLP